ncbi:MAG: hypothetical protein IJK18_06420 [Clostridia bacterium]|nr:hypothetical protein [Clostridia bacterium]
MGKVGFEKYKEWFDSLLVECTEANQVKGKDLEQIRSTMPEEMGTEVYKLGDKSDSLLYVYISRSKDGGIDHLYVYKEISEQSKFAEQPFCCYYNTANQQGKKDELIEFYAPGFVAQYNGNSNKDFFFCKDTIETSKQNPSGKPIDFSDLDVIIRKLPSELKELYCGVGKLHLRKKLTSILKAEALKQKEKLKG